MKFRLEETTTELASTTTATSTPVDVGGMGGDSYSAQIEIDVDTPAAIDVPSADIDFANDNWEYTAHGLSTGLKVQLTTSDTLPAPLATTTDYFVIVIDEDIFQLAASLANAVAGTPITLEDAGVGDQTVTPTALAGASIKLQQSNDYDRLTGVGTWSDLGSATNITVDATVYLEKDRPTSRWIRVWQTMTAGHVTSTLHQLVKGDKDA